MAIDLSSASTGTIFLYSEIENGDSAAFAKGLSSVKGDRITMRLNTPGGSVMEGIAIFNLMRAEPRPIDVVIDGMAGSIGSTIAMGGDTVSIAENAFLFIHSPLSDTGGNAVKLRETADTLDKLKPSLLSAYMLRAKDAAAIEALMAGESYVSAAEALALGLVDKILPAERMAALHFASFPMLSAKALTAAASISKPTAGNENKTQKDTTMPDTNPAVDPAKFDALTAKVDALVAAVEKLTGAPAESPEAKALAAKAEKAESDLVALRKDFDAFVAKAPTSAAFKPDGFQSKAKTVAEIKAEYHGIKDPLEKARFMAAHKSAF